MAVRAKNIFDPISCTAKRRSEWRSGIVVFTAAGTMAGAMPQLATPWLRGMIVAPDNDRM